MLEVKKAWNDKNDATNGKKLHTKPHFLDIRTPIEGLEECKLANSAKEELCTKIYYPGRFIIILGTPQEFMQQCKQFNTAISLLSELSNNGLTIKEFLEQCERKNEIQLT